MSEGKRFFFFYIHLLHVALVDLMEALDDQPPPVSSAVRLGKDKDGRRKCWGRKRGKGMMVGLWV